MSHVPGPSRTLLLVDDEPSNLHILRHILEADYALRFARDGNRAIELVQRDPPDLILLDVMMPGLTGYDVCRQLKSDPATAHIPVIFVTALADTGDEAEGFAAGGVDYIIKPVSAPTVQARVRTHLSLVRVDELARTRLQIVQCLGVAAEYKDNETGLHVMRMSHYARTLALAAGSAKAEADELLHAAPMHDVGKIGIPDHILRKPGPLDDAEWAIMRQHPVIGARIIGEHRSGVLRMARDIAVSHHEKWDGSGYPHGLAGEQIPFTARIVALADVFDALTSERPYKQAWSVAEAAGFIRSQAGCHFDPALVPVFDQCLPEMLEIQARWPEPSG